MPVRWFTGLVAAVLLLAGAIGLGSTITVETNGFKPMNCGNGLSLDKDDVLHKSNVEGLADALLGLPVMDVTGEYMERCTDAVSARRVWAWPLAIVGIIGVLGALAVRTNVRLPVRRYGTVPEPPLDQLGPKSHSRATKPASLAPSETM